MDGFNTNMAPPPSFQVRRREPELIRPVIPTPNQYKQLSDIDCHYAKRLQARILLVYRSDPEKTVDLVKLVRDGLARVLVFYYPVAGRLRERSDGTLVVECNGEGVVFVEGDADLSVEEIGNHPNGYAPYFVELTHDVPGSEGIVGCPLLLVQVTRLKCGGFVIGVRANHTLRDASGKGQFLTALSEMARGATAPSVLPVWYRESPQLNSSQPNFNHKGHEEQRSSSRRGESKPLGRIISRSFVFGSLELATLRASLPEGLRNCSTFELLTSFLWRSRAIAFDLDPEDEVMLSFTVDIRKRVTPTVPKGYYGNAVVSVHALTTAGALRDYPLEYAVSLVRKAKNSVDDKVVRSYINRIAQGERPPLPLPASLYVVSDLTKMGVAAVDFGFGEPAFVIPGMVVENFFGAVDYFLPVMEEFNGEEGVMVPMDLPEQAMERIAGLINDLGLGDVKASGS